MTENDNVNDSDDERMEDAPDDEGMDEDGEGNEGERDDGEEEGAESSGVANEEDDGDDNDDDNDDDDDDNNNNKDENDEKDDEVENDDDDDDNENETDNGNNETRIEDSPIMPAKKKQHKKSFTNPKSLKSKGSALGGSIETKAFALLDGFHEDPETGLKERVTIPLTRLPATLGRSHDTDDSHFFGLGKRKAVSRKQCMIYYRDTQGGEVKWEADSNELAYKEGTMDENDVEEKNKNMKGVADELPGNGFFVIECLGKNRILVNKERVDQGGTALLRQGSPIRISSYLLYFLTPTDAPPKIHTISLPPKSSSGSVDKKRPASVVSNSQAGGTSSKKSKSGGAAGASYQAELDALPVEALLERMTEAIQNNEWERRHQLIGSTISLHAIRDSARDPEIQAEALDGGVSRTDIMAWIKDSPKYSEWTKQMMTKMEPRSYQAAITKSLLKAGFTRTGSSGRYIKWLLPDDIPNVATSKKADDNNTDKKPPTTKKSKTEGKKKSSKGSVPVKQEEEGEKEDVDNQKKENEEDDGDEDGQGSGGDEKEEDDDEEEEQEQGSGVDNDNDGEDEDAEGQGEPDEKSESNDEARSQPEGNESGDEDSGSDLDRNGSAGNEVDDDDDDDDDDDEGNHLI